MLSMGAVKTGYDIRTNGLELMFDTATQQQFLNFNFALQVSIPQLLAELMRFQRMEGAPAQQKAAAVASSGATGPAGVAAPQGVAAVAAAALVPASGAQRPPPQHCGAGCGAAGAVAVVAPPQQQQPKALAGPGGSVRGGVADSMPGPCASGPAPMSPACASAPGQPTPIAATAVRAPAGGPSSGGAGLLGPGSGLLLGGGAPLDATAAAAVAAAVLEPASAQPRAFHGQQPQQQQQTAPVAAAAADTSAVAGGSLTLDASVLEELEKAVVQGCVGDLRAAIGRGVDVSRPLAARSKRSLLHAAIEGAGTTDVVSALVDARCDINAALDDGQTPLHLALANCTRVAPSLPRLLINAKADLVARAADSATPLDLIRRLVRYGGPSQVPTPPVRQLMDEVSALPTMGIGVVEGEQVLGACFADVDNEVVAFYTESVVGLFSVDQGRICLKQKLSQQRVQSVVRHMAVNPTHGAIAVFVEVSNPSGASRSQFQNLIIVWPTGQLQEEEPLKISVDAAGPFGSSSLPPAIVGSTGGTPLALVGRLCSGKVLCWHLNSACSQLVSERELVERGGLVAISGDGAWVAVVDAGAAEDAPGLEVWAFSGHKKCSRVAKLAKRPRHMAIMQHGEPPDRPSDETALPEAEPVTALLALVEEGPASPIEVLLVHVDGTTRAMYSLRVETPCRLIGFCPDSAETLLSAHNDGVIVSCNLSTGQVRMAHDDVAVRSVHASMDRSLLVSASGDTFRIFRV